MTKTEAKTISGINAKRIKALMARESEAYRARRPKSAAAAGIKGFLGGLPMHWMADWPMPFPFIVAKANRAAITDIDGVTLDDFCLGDTGTMFGHSPAPVARAISRQASRGLTTMLPGEDAIAVGALLVDRFRLPFWQIAATASDANRFALRVARAATGRSKILVFNGCYHGAADETFVHLADGRPANQPGLTGEWRDLTQFTKVIEFNDLAALETALKDRDVACVITEPVMTNSAMVLPAPGFHDGLRALTRKYGTLLLIDETHTISSGLGGYSAVHELEPDLFVLGKPVAGGLPAAIWGLSEETARAYAKSEKTRPQGRSGIGTTLSGNPLQMAAMRATLESVMTAENYARMESLAGRLETGLAQTIALHRLPWHVVRVGARVEFICAPGPLKNGGQADLAHAPVLERAIHLALINRGVLIAPFHNMMLVSPVTRPAQVARLIAAFADIAHFLAA